MGSSASTLTDELPSDLDVLQPDRPLARLLRPVHREIGTTRQRPRKKSVTPNSNRDVPNEHQSNLGAFEPISLHHEQFLVSANLASTESFADKPPPAPPASPSTSAASGIWSTTRGRAQDVSPCPIQSSPCDEGARRATSLPYDLDDEFWSCLFTDYIIFDTAAIAKHHAAFRVLAYAAHDPAGPVAQNVARVVRAAVFRIRDYVSSAPGYEEQKEVLGALLLSGKILEVLAEANPSDGVLSHVLAADSRKSEYELQKDARYPMTDALEIGQSILWQLLTCVLDCIIHVDNDTMSAHIVLAAISTLIIALSPRYLSPSNVSSTRSADKQQISQLAVQNADAVSPLLASAVIDMYPNPGAVVANLLDLVADGSPAHRNNAFRLTSSPIAPASGNLDVFNTASSSSRFDLNSSATAVANAMVSSVSRPFTLGMGVADSKSQVLPPKAATSATEASDSSSIDNSLMSFINTRLPRPSLFPPTTLWAMKTGQGSGEPLLNETTSLDGKQTGSPEALVPGLIANSSSRASHEIQELQAAPPSKRQAPRFIARSPTRVAEQALALLGILCAPRAMNAYTTFASHAKSDIKDCSSVKQIHGTARENASIGGAEACNAQRRIAGSRPGKTLLEMDNPYRSALIDTHDVPQHDSADDNCYPFSKLYEILGSWLDDPRGALVAHYFIVWNRRFRTFVLARTDPDVLFLPLLHTLYSRASASSAHAPADAYVPEIIALVLTSDSGFCEAIDEITLPVSSIGWFEDRGRIAGGKLRMSGLAVLVCIRVLQQSVVTRRRVMDKYGASLTVSVLSNVCGTISGMNSLAADRLVALIDFLGRRRRKALVVAVHEATPLSPPPVLSPRPTGSDHSIGWACGGSVEGGRGSADIENVKSEAEEDIAFKYVGTGLTEDNDVNILSDLLDTTLEAICAVLRSKGNVAANRHLMYALLHKESVFGRIELGGTSFRRQALVRRICGVISFFARHLEGPGNSSDGSGDRRVEDRQSELSASHHANSSVFIAEPQTLPVGISVNRVFAVIDEFARLLPEDALGDLPRLRFEYKESREGGEFLLCYAWALVLREMRPVPEWDNLSSAPIPILRAVFHLPSALTVLTGTNQ